MKKFLIKNNKGAALVSIMVAVAFISIIATTLLMISVNNFEMKSEGAQSKRNFYETEQDINVVTAKVRTAIKGASTDPVGEVKNVVGGSSSATTYTGDRIAKLVYPAATSNTVVIDGDTFTFGSGNITVTPKAAGQKVTLQGVSVKQTSSNGFENTIKTDIEFYIKNPISNNADVGVGDCSFLLDNTINVNTSTSTRANINRCTIIGISVCDGIQSVPKTIACNKNGFGDVTEVTGTAADASVGLGGYSDLNFLADYTVVMGDIYLFGNSIMNVVQGNISVFGNIYVADNAAFICNGSLKLGEGCGIYRVGTGGACTKVTGNDPSKNVILGSSIGNLTAADYNQVAVQMKLNDTDPDNDGILPNILVKATQTYEDAAIPGGGCYCYDLCKDDQACEELWMNGQQFYVKIPESNFNGDYKNTLLFVPSASGYENATLAETAPNCTIISKQPVKVEQTHGISLSQIGSDVFNYYLNNDYKFTCKYNGTVYNFNVQDFFEPGCNATVQSVFNSSLGGGGITGVGENGVIFTNWERF